MLGEDCEKKKLKAAMKLYNCRVSLRCECRTGDHEQVVDSGGIRDGEIGLTLTKAQDTVVQEVVV